MIITLGTIGKETPHKCKLLFKTLYPGPKRVCVSNRLPDSREALPNGLPSRYWLDGIEFGFKQIQSR